MTDFQGFNKRIIDEFRANKGKTSGPFANVSLLLLTSTGAKSGKAHTTPLVYTREGDNIVVIASKGGAPTNPAWYHNLVANPEATVELGEETRTVRARAAQGEERERLYRAQAEMMPAFNEYQQRTKRQIPLLVLERVGG